MCVCVCMCLCMNVCIHRILGRACIRIIPENEYMYVCTYTHKKKIHHKHVCTCIHTNSYVYDMHKYTHKYTCKHKTKIRYWLNQLNLNGLDSETSQVSPEFTEWKRKYDAKQRTTDWSNVKETRASSLRKSNHADRLASGKKEPEIALLTEETVMAAIEGRVLANLRNGIGLDLGGSEENEDEGLNLGQAKIGVTKRVGIVKAGGGAKKGGGRLDVNAERHVRDRIPVESLLREVVLLDQIGAQAVRYVCVMCFHASRFVVVWAGLA